MSEAAREQTQMGWANMPHMKPMTFSILGPLEVRLEGAPVAVGGRRQRAVLALLLLRANEVVSADSLVAGLWGESTPRTAAHSLQVFVSDLRKALRTAGEDGRIVTQSPGYRIDVAAKASSTCSDSSSWRRGPGCSGP